MDKLILSAILLQIHVRKKNKLKFIEKNFHFYITIAVSKLHNVKCFVDSKYAFSEVLFLRRLMHKQKYHVFDFHNI